MLHLSPGAISTPGNITLAVGQNSTIDLRGNTGKVFQAGGQFTVFTDILLLDQGISLADLVDAKGEIVTHPNKILHQVILTGPGQTTGEPQATLLLELELINGGPEMDVYNLTVNDSAGWKLSTLPSPISVAGLGHETLRLHITLPAMAGEQDTITVTATSVAELTVTSTAQIVVKVAGEPSASATTTVTVNQPPITTENIGAVNNSEPAVDKPVELPPITENDSSIIPAIDPFSSLPPSTPPCYVRGLVDWVCNANGQKLTDLTIGPNGMMAYGTLVGTLINQGWVSNLTLESNSHLTGGIVTGYINNHGEMADFEFRGAAIVGGTLAGLISNTSPADGYFRDVQLAAGTQLSGGRLMGNISGDAQAPALLEDLEIQAGSHLSQIIIGEAVILAPDITFGNGVQFLNPDDDPRLSVPTTNTKAADETQATQCETQLPRLETMAFNSLSEAMEMNALIYGGIAVNANVVEPPVTLRTSDWVEVVGHFCIDSESVGPAAELIAYAAYRAPTAPESEECYYMLNTQNEMVSWNGELAQLVPFREVVLTEAQTVSVYEGQLPLGWLEIYLGYRLPNVKVLVLTQDPIEVLVME